MQANMFYMHLTEICAQDDLFTCNAQSFTLKALFFSYSEGKFFHGSFIHDHTFVHLQHFGVKSDMQTAHTQGTGIMQNIRYLLF